MKTQTLSPFGLLLEVSPGQGLADVPFPLLEQGAREHGLVVVRGTTSPSRDELLDYCQGVTGFQTLNWDFGPVMEMREIPGAPNYLFSREAVPFHWDGAFHQVPDYLVFSCVESPGPGSGGETLFTSTEAIMRGASELETQVWSRVRLKYETARLAHYGGAIEGPLLQRHPRTGAPILRFAEEVRTELNPVNLTASGVDGVEEVILDLSRRIHDSRYCYVHSWRPGDLLIADNHALIHGRTAFRKDAPRHLRRIQMIREDVCRT